MSKTVKLDWEEAKEIADVLTKTENPDGDYSITENAIADKWNISLEDFYEIVDGIFRMIDFGISPLTQTPFVGISKGNEWLAKKEVCDTNLINNAYDAIEHADEEEPFEERFRVKYLDRKDFESLNFTREFATTSDILNAGCEVYKNDTLNLQIVHYRELNKISISSIDFSKNKTKSSWDENQVNLITAKNKSELQYILNRLGFSPS